MPAYRELNALDLIKEWKKIVGNQIVIGRDAHYLKEFLKRATPVQILLGIYQYRGENITVNQFIKQQDEWFEASEPWAEVELARYISRVTPPQYYMCKDLEEVWDAGATEEYNEARRWLTIWADRVLS